MPKRIHSTRRRGADASPRSKSAGKTKARPAGTLTRRTDDGATSLIDRILDTPHLAQAVPQLPPEMLHRVIRNCGLEDCGAIVALATPEQLMRVFDLDLWRADQAGENEQFDADRFGVWLDVLVDAGVALAAQKLASMNADLLTVAFAKYVLVYDIVAGVRVPDGATAFEVGGYRIVARRSGSWDAIVSVMAALDEQHPDWFHHVMRGCRRLSNSAPEIDGLDDLLADEEAADVQPGVGPRIPPRETGLCRAGRGARVSHDGEAVSTRARHRAARKSCRPRVLQIHRGVGGCFRRLLAVDGVAGCRVLDGCRRGRDRSSCRRAAERRTSAGAAPGAARGAERRDGGGRARSRTARNGTRRRASPTFGRRCGF